MQRRRLLVLAPLVPLGLFASRFLKYFKPKPQQPIDYSEQAMRLNQLAAGIHTPAEAHILVDFVADLFSHRLPAPAVSKSMRAKLAEAEFGAVTDPQKLIPEQRVVEAWNTYARTIEAPPDRRVNVAEVHNLRDAFLATSNLYWTRGMRNIWTVPAIYATQGDGMLAGGCRALESVRVLWDLANMPANLEAARSRVNQGLLASNLFRQAQQRSLKSSAGRVSGGPGRRNPVEEAERQYEIRNGRRALDRAVVTMLEQTLS